MITTPHNGAVKHWFALYTKPRSEFKAEIQLNALGIQNYLPVVQQLKQWSDRKKLITEPLLRGYIFIYSTDKDRITALEQPAIVRCVTERGRAVVIPEQQMDNLIAFVHKEKQYTVYNGLLPGTKVRIAQGPFAGVEGIITTAANGNQFAVTVELLNRTIITYVSENELIQIQQA